MNIVMTNFIWFIFIQVIYKEPILVNPKWVRRHFCVEKQILHVSILLPMPVETYVKLLYTDQLYPKS